ncbi:hypothetical protein GGTG_02274 [Gaeumannomyces tritici R3-111a-1]|uniref:Uncharacterized protein n=1 Tax=Gaeumannomyces tritici (strain R3-111a-1) TaxID=644352 RepID=J3NLW9_GAET3|nr:hypothetical protein GGTG_02274 [Gaeumannomyces tritici R3-111a-1]EJT82300.1 hypothetical protein GGTG_02274 [Gaeumannomyces tritici R3-111a-1]
MAGGLLEAEARSHNAVLLFREGPLRPRLWAACLVCELGRTEILWSGRKRLRASLSVLVDHSMFPEEGCVGIFVVPPPWDASLGTGDLLATNRTSSVAVQPTEAGQAIRLLVPLLRGCAWARRYGENLESGWWRGGE